jgi:hypothetical protein
MGSTMVTATDESYNPAMIVRDRPALAFRYAVTDFDNADDTTFVVWGLDATVPLSDRDAIKLAYADLDTGREPTSLIPSPGARLRLTGQHASIVYGREFTDRLRVGVALAVLLDSARLCTSPGVRTTMARGSVWTTTLMTDGGSRPSTPSTVSTPGCGTTQTLYCCGTTSGPGS